MIKGFILGKVYPDAAIITHEVHDRLHELGHELAPQCMEVHYQLQFQFTVEEDWGVLGTYIVGRINADVSKIREVIEPGLESATFEQAWDALVKSGVVEVTEEGIALPLLAGKLDTLDDLQVRLDHERVQLKKGQPVDGRLVEGNEQLSRAVAELRATIERDLRVADELHQRCDALEKKLSLMDNEED